MRSETYTALRQAIQDSVAAATATGVSGPATGKIMLLAAPDNVSGSLGDDALDAAVKARLSEIIEDGGAVAEEIEGSRVFFEAHLPPPHLIVVGAVHIAIPLVSIARIMGFETTVIDARGVFATEERFPHSDDLIEAWPDEGLAEINLHPGVAAVILAHDEKFEDPALDVLLRSDVGYIGAIGSRKTSQERLVRLKARGFTDEQLERIHGPVGLNLGGRAPEEVAISIMAEIVAVKNGVDPSRALAAAKSA
ncbi:XdhC/CoxI family protein [soil metagenome]